MNIIKIIDLTNLGNNYKYICDDICVQYILIKILMKKFGSDENISTRTTLT